MSLATRCPACGTVFRVVQDQLRVSDGWVRCGRCAEVFNAAEKLVDLELDSPPPRETGAPSHRDRVIEDLARVAGQPVPPPAPWSGAGAAPAASIEHQPHPGAGPDAVPDSDPDSGPDPGPDSDSDLDPSRPAEPALELRAEPPPFVRDAERAARWRSSRQRAMLAGAVLLAAAALGLQVALAYRDLIAARWSALQPPLALLCGWAGCSIEPPRQADALVVDSSGLVRVDQTSTYRLSLVLRNRAPIALALPAVELSLTDAQGALIARRVLDAAELGVVQRHLPGGAELSMKALLAVGERPVSGYTIEVFYP